MSRSETVHLKLMSGQQVQRTSTEQESAANLPPGTSVGSYFLGELVSRGGGGFVYRATHKMLGRVAAVKVMRSDLAASSQMLKRFFLEALAVNVIRHPNIVDVYEFGELPDGRPFYVMEYLEGINLREYLETYGRQTPAEALALIEPVCAALAAAHKAGFVHRDVKASNVHLSSGPEGQRIIKLLDFGIAKSLQPQAASGGLTVAGSRMGTSTSMAPEQILGLEIGPQTDIYALGILLFRLLTLHNPFESDDPRELDEMHLHKPVPRVSDYVPVPAAVDAVVATAMRKNPQERFPTVAAFLDAFRAAISSEPARPQAPSRRGLAILLELSAAEGADDEAVVEDMLLCQDLAEPRLTQAGFKLAVQTGSTLLAVRPIEGDPARARQETLALSQQIGAALMARPGAEPRVRLSMRVHSADAVVQDGLDGPEIVGGPLMDVATWGEPERDDTVVTMIDRR